jgi:hypothetical protein
MTKHTPGPWKSIEGADIVRTENGEYISKIGGGTDAECEANARLIAAAPDLLSAATKLLAVFDDISKNNKGWLGKLVLQDYAQLNEALIEVPAAIAKAKGNQ